jgi:hypothetical protein
VVSAPCMPRCFYLPPDHATQPCDAGQSPSGTCKAHAKQATHTGCNVMQHAAHMCTHMCGPARPRQLSVCQCWQTKHCMACDSLKA